MESNRRITEIMVIYWFLSILTKLKAYISFINFPNLNGHFLFLVVSLCLWKFKLGTFHHSMAPDFRILGNAYFVVGDSQNRKKSGKLILTYISEHYAFFETKMIDHFWKKGWWKGGGIVGFTCRFQSYKKSY